MAQICLTQYFTPKRSRHSSTVLANGESIKSQKRKLKVDDEENNENLCLTSNSSNKKRRISPSQPTDSYLPGCDLDQIDKVPLSRKNRFDAEEKKIKSFDRQKTRLEKVVDLNELRQHLTAVRTHIDQIKEVQTTPKKLLTAHERFAHLLVEKPSISDPSPSTPSKKIASPADLRRTVQNNENERLKKVLAKVDASVIESLPSTPSKRITGVNQRLLEQIRLKEEARTQLNCLAKTGLIVNEEQRLKKSQMFHHLRESIEIIDQLFTTERQVALEFDRIRSKLVELHSARFTEDQGAEMFDFILQSMEECACGYFLPMKLRNKQYIKINRTKMSLVQFNEYVQNRLNEFNQ